MAEGSLKNKKKEKERKKKEISQRQHRQELYERRSVIEFYLKICTYELCGLRKIKKEGFDGS